MAGDTGCHDRYDISGRTYLMSTTVHHVKGMTCGHCVSSVSAEIGKLAGVTDVAVDLDTGDVTITSIGDIDPAQVRAAVDEAGYELVG